MRVAQALVLGGLVAGLSSCSLVLDLDECEIDAHCPEAGQLCQSGTCAAIGETELIVAENITGDVTWTSARTVRLTEVIYVEPGATLTIEGGTTIFGEQGSALVVQAGGQLLARGTQFEPVVFTSSKPEGERLPGDWGGVALLGNAPVNSPGPVLEGVREVERAGYGGSDDGHSCGVLEYVRIEFAGFPLQQDEELNGLTVAGCGSGTLLNFIQVHFGLDDGIEFFGGSANLRHAVITRAQDDSLDYDQGWTGSAQFIAIQQDADGDNGIEASSNEDDSATPRTAPRIWNLTVIGSGGEGSQRGATFKEGVAGDIVNAIFLGHPIEAIDIKDESTVSQLESGDLMVRNTMFWSTGEGGTKFFPTVEDETDEMPDDERDDDGGFDEDAFFRGDDSLVLGTDPMIPEAFNLEAPGWVPLGSAAADAAASPPAPLFDGFDESARYAGAFHPGQLPWTQDWTAYPPS